jgi:Ni,Fe-hydrogenase III large subunit/Ni,Fe-hydrogenase III component G
MAMLPGAQLRHDNGQLRRWQVPAAQLEAVVHSLVAADGGRLADLFADTGPDGRTVLYLVWALDRDGYYLLLDSPVDGDQYPPLSDIAPAAFIEECEIYEQFGLRPAGGKPLNRLAVPPQADATVPRLGHPPASPPAEVHAPHTVGGQAFEFPVGPVRGAGAESLYFGLVTSGEEVVDLYLMTWHKHRGIEWRLRGRTPREAMFVVERAEGLSAVAHGWAFAAAVESACGIPIAAAATRSRAVALELERLYNHAAAVAALCQSTGLQVGQARAEIALEKLLRCNLAVFGHRYLFGVLDIGGVTRVPDLSALHQLLPDAHDELRRVTDALSVTNSFLDRLEATGVVTAEQVRRLGLVGPVARAAGVPIDTRRDHPHPDLPAQPAATARTTGDVLSRYETFLAELDASTKMLLGTSDVAATNTELDGDAGDGAGEQGMGWAESARGEALAFVRLDDTGRIARARLRPAAVRNWRGFDDAARSQNVFTDIPIIEASFWLTVAGVSR